MPRWRRPRYTFSPFDLLLDRWCRMELKSGHESITGRVHHCDKDGRVYLKRADSICGAKTVYLSTAIVPVESISVIQEISSPDWAEFDNSSDSSDDEFRYSDDECTDDLEAVIMHGPRGLVPSQGYVYAPNEDRSPVGVLRDGSYVPVQDGNEEVPMQEDVIPGASGVAEEDFHCDEIEVDEVDENVDGNDFMNPRKRKMADMAAGVAKAARYDDLDESD